MKEKIIIIIIIIIINPDPPLFVAVYQNQSGDFFHYLRKNF